MIAKSNRTLSEQICIRSKYIRPKKNICMFVVTRQYLLKITDPKLFFRENLQKIIEDIFKNIYVSLGTTSDICLIKSQGFASTVPCNVIELV